MKRIGKYDIVAFTLGLSVLAETGTYTYVQQSGATFFYSSSVVYFLAGLAISVLPLLYVGSMGNRQPPQGPFKKIVPVLFTGFFLFLLAYHAVILGRLYNSFKIDKQWADMIPTIQLACERLLHGKPVYAPMSEIKPGALNAYLPMMWLPYVPAVFFGYDPRWTTVGALFIALFIIGVPIISSQGKVPLPGFLIACISLFLGLNYFLMKYNGFWAMTEEALPAAFYMILGYALIRKNYYLTGVAMMCCLLSRYSLVMWIPVYLGYIFFSQSRKDFLTLLITFGLAVSAVFIIPFFIWNPLYFLQLPAHQAGGMAWFWSCYHLSERAYYNVGLFKFFAVNQVNLMAYIQVASSFMIPLLFLSIVKKLESHYKFNERYLGFASLKLSMVCFYNFFPVPYVYLFFPATFISYAVLFDYLALGESDSF